MSVLVAERMRASASRVLDAWLLRTAEQRVRGYEPAQAALVRRLWDAAATRRLAARELADPRLAPAAIALARDAAMLYVAARRAADDRTWCVQSSPNTWNGTPAAATMAAACGSA